LNFLDMEWLGPIPISIIILLIIVSAGWFLLARTKFGSHLYGVGGNSEVARLSGVRTDRVLIIAHVICSMTAVLAGLFLVSQMRSGAPWVGPNGIYDLNSIAATVIGGTALAGGKVGVGYAGGSPDLRFFWIHSSTSWELILILRMSFLERSSS